MNAEFMAVLDYLENERGIDRETLVVLIEESMVSAARKVVAAEDVHVQIDRQTCDIDAYAVYTVVEEVEDPTLEMTLAKARTHDASAALGDTIKVPVPQEKLGRIAAQTAKQAITHRLRQAEKEQVCTEFADQVGQLVTGMVRRVERGDIYVDFGRAEGVIRYKQRIPGEEYQQGDHITAVLLEVNPLNAGPALVVSRADPSFVRCLFEREVAEIAENMVEIKAISREPGYRTKLAVHSSQERVDPVGACVGVRGNRVKTVVRELAGEKVDIIRWDPDIRTFVTNALQPAKLSGVTIDEEEHCLMVQVPEDQLSLAIGKKGQNARLAAKLTGWRIDINKQEKPSQRNTFEDQVRRATQALAEIDGIGEDAAAALVANGFLSLEGIVEANVNDLADIEGLDLETAESVMAAARTQLGY